MKKKVIIIGGGFAGISAAKGLKNSDFEVLLIDKKNHHLFQPLLYQVASAALSPGDISVPLREVIGKYKNIKILLDEVISIDKKNKQIGFFDLGNHILIVGTVLLVILVSLNVE